jgi:two-component sensor histidine kinase
MQETDVVSLLMLPLTHGDRVFGLVELVTDHHERTFTAEEIEMGQAMADQAAVAIHNAQLYERAQGEITERHQAEQKLRVSLHEKEILLKEIHHRVKNNLQVVSSLLSLQARQIDDERAVTLINDSQNRVRAMALIHEKLYQSSDLSSIDFAEYVRGLTQYLIRTYGSATKQVTFHVQAEDVWLSLNAAVPCGLIINELVSNAFEHAFPDDFLGTIELTASMVGDMVTLTIADNGVGIPAEEDILSGDTLGVQLVHSLVSQLDGDLTLHRENGTRFEITFCDPHGTDRVN